MSYQAYKGRVLESNVPVEVYRNLHNGMLSVRQRGLVVAHVHTIDLIDVTFKVNESGRQRVIRDKKKNVHAFVCGIPLSVNWPTGLNVQRAWQRISYNPYMAGTFMAGSQAARAGDQHVHISAALGVFISKFMSQEA